MGKIETIKLTNKHLKEKVFKVNYDKWKFLYQATGYKFEDKKVTAPDGHVYEIERLTDEKKKH